jgi:cytochrome c
MKVSTVSSLWDYIRRAMPWNAPKSLTVDEVYAALAYLLNLGDIVPADFVLSDRNMAQVQELMPNRNGMVRAPGLWDVRGRPDVRNVACMKDCPTDAQVISALPEFARNAHGNLAEQNRAVGPVRGSGARIAQAEARATPAELAGRHGCLACHSADRRLVGPSFREVAARYHGQAGLEDTLVAKVRQGGGGAWGAVPMPPHAGLDAADLRALVRWVLDGAK